MKSTGKKILTMLMATLLLSSTCSCLVFNASAEGEFTSDHYTNKEDTYVLPQL